MNSPLWPAQLRFVVRESDQPEALVAFYRDALNLHTDKLSADCWALHGPDRQLLIQRGAAFGQPSHGFALTQPSRLQDMRNFCQALGHACEAVDNPFLTDAFALTDPDGRKIVFGVDNNQSNAAQSSAANALRGRLQHVVVATTDLQRVCGFYQDLGFAVSDHVHDGEPDAGKVTASFLRSDTEHHSFAAFLAPQRRPDHFSLETDSWNDIRDWADHMAGLGIKLWWGPGRHGPGNNLFFMIEDPEGYKLELSAELEHLDKETAPRHWKHEERTLNLWGGAWMRS